MHTEARTNEPTPITFAGVHPVAFCCSECKRQRDQLSEMDPRHGQIMAVAYRSTDSVSGEVTWTMAEVVEALSPKSMLRYRPGRPSMKLDGDFPRINLHCRTATHPPYSETPVRLKGRAERAYREGRDFDHL